MARKAGQIGLAVLGGIVFSLGLGWSQDFPDRFPTLAGGTIGIEELAQGRWALGFVVLPGCPACEEFLPWFSHAAQVFLEMRFLLVAPEATAELRTMVEKEAAGIPVLLDEGGLLGARLGVERAPTVLLFVEGVFIDRLDWPFTEGKLFRKLAEPFLVKIEIPNPKELLGQPAPDFSATDLQGKEITLVDLPRPLLLVFVNLTCFPCWEILPPLAVLSRELAVALVAFGGEAGLSKDDRERLEQFLGEVKERDGRAVVLLDTWDREKGFKLVTKYKVTQSPTFMVIDEKGVVAGVWEGRLEDPLEAVRAVLRD